MANFVEVPATAIESHLSGKQFVRTVQYQEVVYIRAAQRNPDVKLKVYTSIRNGQQTVRRSGKDAVRVCVVFDNGRRSFGIGKFPSIPRVHSVESVLRRVDERIRAAKIRALEWIQEQEKKQAGTGFVRPAPVPGTDDFNAQWVAHKNEFARMEAEVESRAFMNDPDMRQMPFDGEDPEVELAHRECGLYSNDDRHLDLDDRDPCSEPPQSLFMGE
jgi:hypothetical protein